MDQPNVPTDLATLKQKAYNAAGNVSQMATDAPGLLTQLKQNLVGIFAKDNPVLTARDDALSKYLATPDNTRSEILTNNLPEVSPGRALTLSPTQQNAIVSSRSAAALAPLAGLNEIIKAQYGNIGDVVQGAGGIYDATLKGAQSNASNLLDLYKTAVEEQKAKTSAANAGGLDLATIIAAISHALGVSGGAPTDISGLDDIFNIENDPSRVYTTPEGLKYVKNANGAVELYDPNKANNTLIPELNNIKLNTSQENNPNTLSLPGASPSPFANLFGGQQFKF
jgi:hypothetical protein